jgi:hypothetical protein
MSIEKNITIEIRQIANGFLVMPPFSGDLLITDTDRQVYQTMEGLIDFLKGHFTHRESFVPVDDRNNLAKGNK